MFFVLPLDLINMILAILCTYGMHLNCSIASPSLLTLSPHQSLSIFGKRRETGVFLFVCLFVTILQYAVSRASSLLDIFPLWLPYHGNMPAVLDIAPHEMYGIIEYYAFP